MHVLVHPSSPLGGEMNDRGCDLVSALRTAIQEKMKLHEAYKPFRDKVAELQKRWTRRLAVQLYQRYKRQVAHRGYKGTFSEWLDGKKLEETYESQYNGFSHPVRRRWATWVIQQLTDPFLVLYGQEPMEWVRTAIQDEINRRVRFTYDTIRVEFDRLEEDKDRRLVGGLSIRFTRIEDTDMLELLDN